MNIEFLDAGCGDAIHIRFKGIDDKYHNIIIDGGIENGDVYPSRLKKKLEQVIENAEHIDLWIITHIDDDHIGGVLRLLKDTGILNALDLSKTKFWFNYSIWDYDTGIREDNLKSVRQGIRLREYLKKNSTVEAPITDALGTINLWGVALSILSPDEQHYAELLKKWEKEEQKIRQKDSSGLKRGGNNDYDIKIENFDITDQEEDKSEENASSIAFLLRFNDKTVLFTSDSNPSVLTKALAKLNDGKKVKVDYMQVPHHGSRYNINNALLELIDCGHYIICADGHNKSNLPNKASMVKILKANPGKEIHFYLTQSNNLTRNIFTVDIGHTIPVHFPHPGSIGLNFIL